MPWGTSGYTVQPSGRTDTAVPTYPELKCDWVQVWLGIFYGPDLDSIHLCKWHDFSGALALSPWRSDQALFKGQLPLRIHWKSREAGRCPGNRSGHFLSHSAHPRVRPMRALSCCLLAKSLAVSAVLFDLAVASLDWSYYLWERAREEGSAQGAPLMRAEGTFIWNQRTRSKLCWAWGWPRAGGVGWRGPTGEISTNKSVASMKKKKKPPSPFY